MRFIPSQKAILATMLIAGLLLLIGGLSAYFFFAHHSNIVENGNTSPAIGRLTPVSAPSNPTVKLPSISSSTANNTVKPSLPARTRFVLNQKYVHFSYDHEGELMLRSNDVQESAITSDVILGCAYPKSSIGKREYKGNFRLYFGNDELDLGKLAFVEGSQFDGSLVVEKLDPESDQDFVLLGQYGSCDAATWFIYGYDSKEGKLIRYRFNNDGRISNYVISMQVPSVQTTRELVTKDYSNLTAETYTTKWKFEPATLMFIASE
jgi:hypothetical protein